MSLLVWNYCGLGNLRTGKELEVLIRAKDPSIVFLAETWADEVRLKEVQRNIKFDNLFYVERNPRGGGGLALYWKNSIDVHVDSFSKYHIDSIINKGNDEAWRFTGFYGEPATHKRIEAWNKLRLLNTKHNLPWLCARDFNEITRHSKKLGGNSRSQDQMQLFRDVIDVIDECGFLDLGYMDDQFTWRKHFADGHSLWERLDRGLANHDWFMKFSGSKVHHLHLDSSDHSPLWITLDGLDIPSFSKPFRFEEMWLSDHGCSDIIEAVWLSKEGGEVQDHVICKIDKCGKELREWNRNCFGNVRTMLSRKRKELKEAEKVAMRSGNNHQVRELQKEIAELVDKENRLWFQRSKIMWAKFGDRNSKFFHSQASQMKRKNLIRKLKDPNGRVVEDNEGITKCVVQYYQNLLSSANQQFCDSVTDSIQTMITEEMNSKLSSEFTHLEVKQAINQMAPLKAPRLDGMPPLFYQHY